MSNIVGERLRAARETKDLTQVQVMHYTNINNKTLMPSRCRHTSLIMPIASPKRFCCSKSSPPNEWL